MVNVVLPSTLLLTILLAIGLMFFIKASVKDRIQVLRLITQQPEESFLAHLQQYFDQRAYRLVAVDTAKNQVVFEGMVRPSLFLAIFLTLLAFVGVLCLGLVLSILFPGLVSLLGGVFLLSPLVGVFYWRKAGRVEQVLLKIEVIEAEKGARQNLVTVTGHRDELAELQRSLPLNPFNAT